MNRPPRWAEWVLRTMLPLRDKDTVTGDLLEAYRDSVEPTRGRVWADAWYLGQASGYLWRLCRLPALALLGSLVVSYWLERGLVALGALPHDVRSLVWVMDLAGLAPPFLTLGIIGGLACRRAGSVVAGAMAGALAALLFTTLSLVAVLVGVAWWQPQSFSTGTFEDLARRLLWLAAVGTLAGGMVSALGALVGWATRRSVPSERQPTSA